MADRKDMTGGVSNRKAGVLMLILSFLMAVYIGFMIWQAKQGIYMEDGDTWGFIALFPLTLTFGAIFSVYGDEATSFMGHRTRPSALGWIILVVTGVVGAALALGVRAICDGV